MAAVDNTVKRSIKFKITSKGIRDESEEKARENIMNNECKDGVTVNGNKNSMSVRISMLGNSNKRKPGVILECQREKKQRMDQSFKKHCNSLLRSLMEHPHGFAFNQPVDPVKLKIPDYFSIITNPMDLGTIKRKLEDNMYFDAEEFARDVRLTFSNAILYNPPGNFVHNFAKELSDVFSRRWKLLEANSNCMGRNLEQLWNIDEIEKNGQDTMSIIEKKGQNAKQTCLTKASVRISVVNRRPMSLEEKRNLRKELVKMSSRKMTGNLRSVFQKFGFARLKEETLDSYIDAIDDETLLELKRAIKVSLDATEGKVKPARTTQSGCPTLVTTHKDNGNRIACATANRKPSHDSPAVKCATCGSLMCQCSLRRCSVKPYSSDFSSERSSDRDHCGDSKPDRGVKYPVTSHTRGLKLDSNGHEIVSNEENFQQRISSPATSASVEGWTSLVNVHMSPKKALRAAMLKSRFADTIFRATQQTLQDHDDKINPVNVQKERERLKRQQREEKARIEAEIRAAEAASQTRAVADLKMQRERERETARIAVEKMGKTVNIDENQEILEDFEAIIGAISGGNFRNPLEQLGLYLKDDYMEEDEEAILQVEDGEILS
ncbi:Transcription factor GTE8 [Forsythia ovata]|uniref:Transcription factor GTE8 n=1 Tax=Forsythia ovata TaxID=205694 RepID=A0ABD1S361_9LAMI